MATKVVLHKMGNGKSGQTGLVISNGSGFQEIHEKGNAERGTRHVACYEVYNTPLELHVSLLVSA